jgi:hypothetical protein
MFAATLALAGGPVAAAQAVTLYPTLEPAAPNGANGWYVGPVTVRWHTDATNSNCPLVQRLDVDTPGTQLTCTAWDDPPGGGSTTATTPVIHIDRTPPALGPLQATAQLGRATLGWSPPPDAAVTIARLATTPGGPPQALPANWVGTGHAVDHFLAPGVTYSWLLTATDAAGNTSTALASTVWQPPVLQWRARRHARYYNVQLFRGHRQLLSAWPHHASFAVPAGWRLRGRDRHLGPGRYRWYAWPGFGRRSARNYGRLAARGHFTVR